MGYFIVLEFRQLAWDVWILAADGVKIWQKSGFQGKDLGIKAAEGVIDKGLESEETVCA